MKPCPPKPDLRERPLLSPEQATALVGVFKVLANDTRLRLLHALVRWGERSVTELASELGMTPQAISNQLQRLVDRDILAPRRVGNHIRYRIIDQCVIRLLDQGLCLTECTESRRLVASPAAPGLPSPDDR